MKIDEHLVGSNPKCIYNNLAWSEHQNEHFNTRGRWFSIHDYRKFGICVSVSGRRGAPLGEAWINKRQLKDIFEHIKEFLETENERS